MKADGIVDSSARREDWLNNRIERTMREPRTPIASAWNEQARNPLTTLVRIAVLGAVFIVAWLFAKHALVTDYRLYDDEGYMLLSIDHYLSGGHLYTDVFTQYGPFNFFAEGGLFRLLGGAVSHDTGRLATLILWLISSVLAGCFIYAISKDQYLASAASLGTLLPGVVLAYGPGHPQQLILPILMLACCLSTLQGSPRATFAWLGALGSALFFTKINVGVFYFVGLACVLICGFPAGPRRRIGTGLLLAYAVGFPLILVRSQFPAWAGFSLVAILSAFTTFLLAVNTAPICSQPWQRVLYAMAGALTAGSLIVTATLLSGMSVRTLMDGVLWEPLKHPKVFTFPLYVSRAKMCWALLISLGMVLLYWFRDRWTAYARWIDGVRFAAGLCGLGLLPTAPWRIVWVLPLLPLALLPASGRVWSAVDFMPRVLVTSLAATQFLQSYPVAGTQLGMSASLVALWGFVCIHDGASALLRVAPRLRGQEALGFAMTVAFAALMIGSGRTSLHYSYPASHLRGASSLHLSQDLEDRFGFLAKNIGANCDFLFSLPMLGSLNYWSGVPSANGLNHNDWVKTFGVEQQKRILSKFEANPRACAVYNKSLLEFWQTTPDEIKNSPLARYIVYDMKRVSEIDGYEIRVSPRRESQWVEVVANPRASQNCADNPCENHQSAH